MVKKVNQLHKQKSGADRTAKEGKDSMKKYRRFTKTDRLKLEALYNSRKFTIRQIAAELGFSPSSVCTELKHGYYNHLNTDYTETKKYSADRAQFHCDFSITTKRPPLKVGNDYKFIEIVEYLILKRKRSPDEVVHIIKTEYPDLKTQICTTTLYSYINQGLFPNLTNKDLFFQGKRKKKRKYNKVKKLPRGLSIEKRSDEINERSSFGHWELDTVIGTKKKSNTLLVFTERLTRYELILRAKDKSALSTIKVLNRIERAYGKNFRKIFKTITVDNGCEFSNSEGMENSCLTKKKRTTVYHCHPYSSYERGSNENQNRLIRQFIPKGKSINYLSDTYIREVQDYINNKYRKIFGYRTSADLFFEQLAQL